MVNPVPAQAIADTRKSVADRLQLGLVTSREKLASVITALPPLSVRVTRYAVIPDAFQAIVASVAPACCSRIVVSMNHAVMICVFKGKIVMVKAVFMTLTALVVKRAVVRSVQMARIASVSPVRRVAIAKLQKAVVKGLVKVQIAISQYIIHHTSVKTSS